MGTYRLSGHKFPTQVRIISGAYLGFDRGELRAARGFSAPGLPDVFRAIAKDAFLYFKVCDSQQRLIDGEHGS